MSRKLLEEAADRLVETTNKKKSKYHYVTVYPQSEEHKAALEKPLPRRIGGRQVIAHALPRPGGGYAIGLYHENEEEAQKLIKGHLEKHGINGKTVSGLGD